MHFEAGFRLQAAKEVNDASVPSIDQAKELATAQDMIKSLEAQIGTAKESSGGNETDNSKELEEASEQLQKLASQLDDVTTEFDTKSKRSLK